MDNKSPERAEQPATVVGMIDANIIGIVEGLDTTVSGTRSAADQLESWTSHFGLDDTCHAVQGLPSSECQELCALYKRSIGEVTHKLTLDKSKHPFNKSFLADINEALVMELYEHYRQPHVNGHMLWH